MKITLVLSQHLFNLLQEIEMTKRYRKQVTCRCEAYPFPHRIDSKACRELYNSEQDDDDYEKDSVQSLGLSSLFAPDNSTPIRF